MRIPVLVEPLGPNSYRASAFGLSAEGATRDEALQKLRALFEGKWANGAEIVPLEVPPFEHPGDRFVGTWAEDDPLLAEWEKAVEEYRRSVDADPNYR
jgi:hypothetical protein